MRAGLVVSLALVLVAGFSAPAGGQTQQVIVNGKALTAADLAVLRQRHRLPESVAIAPGRYWYDRVSGLWGMEGGPTQGQLLAGLELGGPLQADASGGGTGVFINGRELHPEEVAYLQRLFGYVVPGRYWLNHLGVGGQEGGPPLFNLVAAAQQANQVGGYSYTRRTPFGSIGSDGSCSYYMGPDGSSVMTGSC